MKNTILFLSILMFNVGKPSLAQNCKPDYYAADDIAKELIESWDQLISEPEMGNPSASPTDYYFTISVGHKGALYAITVKITKADENFAQSLLETKYRANKGDVFSYEFANGDSLSFTANEASTFIKAEPAKGELTGKMIATIVLQKTMSLEEILVFKDKFTTQKLQAASVKLSNVQFDAAVSEAKTVNLLTKLNCFYKTISLY